MTEYIRKDGDIFEVGPNGHLVNRTQPLRSMLAALEAVAPKQEDTMADQTPAINAPFDNGLTPAQSERLYCLSEECGEVIQAVGKTLRHGFDSCHPMSGESNRDYLTRELGDLMAVMMLMREMADIDEEAVIEAAEAKIDNMPVYMHHQENMPSRGDIR